MDADGTMQDEISRKEKDKNHMISLIFGTESKKQKNERTKQTSSQTQTTEW